MPTADTPTPEQTVRALVADLRSMADWLEAKAATIPTVSKVYVPATTCTDLINLMCDSPEELAAATRWLGTAAKNGDDNYMRVERSFGEHLTIEAWALRAEVCEQVQVGTKPVVQPDATSPEHAAVLALEEQLAAARAAVPTVTVEEPVMGWDCKPVLAGERVA